MRRWTRRRSAFANYDAPDSLSVAERVRFILQKSGLAPPS